MSCINSPTWLRFTTNSNRSQVGSTTYSYMNKANGNDQSQTTCTNYCPGDGSNYNLYSGLNLQSTTVITAKIPGNGCSNGQSSNGGIDCSACTQLKSDWSQCIVGDGTYIKTQFARTFLNSQNDRENKNVNCLPTSKDISADELSISGSGGKKCKPEGTNNNLFQHSTLDGSTLDNLNR